MRRMRVSFILLWVCLPLYANGQTLDLTHSEGVANPYGLAALWAQGDWVARGTLLMLLGMSVMTWSIALNKGWAQRQTLTLGQQLRGKHDATLSARMAQCPPSPYLALVQAGQSAQAQAQQNPKLNADSWIANAIDDAVDRVQGELQAGMTVLATVGATSPFVGLFGTVWGIYHALTAIGISGQASLDKVAGPVGEALIMTAMGLAVAVPAVLCYNALLRRNRRILDLTRLHGNHLHAELVIAIL